MKNCFAVLCIILFFILSDCRPDQSSDTNQNGTPDIASIFENSGVPGISVAVIRNFEIAYLEVHGARNFNTGEPVTERTLFQAASISKTVTAMACLKMVQENRMNLDGNINSQMITWQVPENIHTSLEKVTPFRLMSHTAGTTVHGFPGYRIDGPFPTLVQVLNGSPPANTDPVVVDTVPGTVSRYSGGGYCILQQAMVDIERNGFHRIMHDCVLEPLGMADSTFEQPLPNQLTNAASAGHDRYRGVVQGSYHVYPEMAAAGLWTTAKDLALFLIELQLSLSGESNRVLNREFTELMMSPVLVENYALGLMIMTQGGEVYFGHGGANEGFRCFMKAHKNAGVGAVVMTNSDNGDQLTQDIIDFIGRTENWPGY